MFEVNQRVRMAADHFAVPAGTEGVVVAVSRWLDNQQKCFRVNFPMQEGAVVIPLVAAEIERI